MLAARLLLGWGLTLGLFLGACVTPTAGPSAPTSAPTSTPPLPTPAGAPTSVKAAFPQPTSIVEAAYVAVEAGFFAQHGLEVSLSQVEANAQVASVLSGEIPYAFCADPANESAVVAAIARYTQSSLEDARTGYEAMRPVTASKPVPTEDPEAVRNVLAVSPNPQVATTDPTSLIDNSILESLRATTT